MVEVLSVPSVEFKICVESICECSGQILVKKKIPMTVLDIRNAIEWRRYLYFEIIFEGACIGKSQNNSQCDCFDRERQTVEIPACLCIADGQIAKKPTQE
jgi:hypothetical protein